jgi:FKBP-type peptidyl-prolyl cis-trans isomerase
MKEGGKQIRWFPMSCPSGATGVIHNATLIFEVELLDVQ